MNKKLTQALGCIVLAACSGAACAQSLSFDITEFVVDGNTLLGADRVQSALAPFVGPQRSMADVKQAAEALRLLFAQAGYTVVQVIPPAQTVTAGQVRLQVVEDKITAIEVTGNSQYTADNIRASLPALRTGASLNARTVESAIVLANENAAKQVALNVKPGQQPGDIIATVQVQEDRIRKWTATYDNTGAPTTGLNKIGLIYQHANLFDRDHALTLQYNGTTENIDKVYSLSAGYHVPLYARGLSLDFIAAYSSSSGQNVNLYFAGKGTVLGARVNAALPSWGSLRQKFTLGLDYKDSESVSGPLLTPITETPVSLNWAAQWANPAWQGSLGLSHVRNLPSGGNGADSAYYNTITGTGARIPLMGPAATTLPSAQWSLWRLNANASVALPQDWQARFALNGQNSGHLLLPSEQFGVGGTTSVRGYPDRIAAGDNGHSLSAELYTPELAKGLGLANASVRALLFWEQGHVSLNDTPIPAGVNDGTAVEGVGVGLRATFGKNVSVKWDMGWAQKPAGSAPTEVRTGDIQSNVAVAVTY